MKKLVFLTGAGISAESGIPTFRKAVDSLWENQSIETVCVSGCLDLNADIVHDFYNNLRKKYSQCKPNSAHLDIAELEKKYNVVVITQNVDNLHEQAGSSKVIHLHGEFLKCRSISDPEVIFDIPENSNGDRNTYDGMMINGHEVRPHIVFFGEDVPNILLAEKELRDADICVVVGTSFNVYPAAGLVGFVDVDKPIYYIDPDPAYVQDYPDLKVIKATATEGMKKLIEILDNETSI